MWGYAAPLNIGVAKGMPVQNSRLEEKQALDKIRDITRTRG